MMEIIYLLVGLTLGLLLGVGLTKYFKQNKKLVDISNFENNPEINYFKKNIFIGNPNFKKKKNFDVYIPTKTPGVDKNGLTVHSDGISVIKLKKLINSPYESVEEILTKVLGT